MHPALIITLSVLGGLAVLFGLYLFLIAPRFAKKREIQKYVGIRYAHRGLHDKILPENSLGAFAAACEYGYGIELDVRLSKDGELVVFHDDTLDRMTTESGRVDERDAADLKAIKLAASEEGIPTFREVLELVDGRVPLLVEIKEDAGKLGVTRKTAEMLAKYKGDYIIESFNPLAIAEIKKLMPNVIRGVLSQNFLEKKEYKKPLYGLLQCLVLNVLARPDFIAFDHNGHKNAALKLCRSLFGATTVAWTTRSESEDALAISHGFDAIIFEHYTPKTQIKD